MASLRVGFIGAGAVNFGGAEGPWDHASRLEKIDGLKIVAICDCMPGKAESVLAVRRRGCASSMYEECQVYQDYNVMLSKEKLDAVFVGVPPFAHGCFEHPIELKCAQVGIHSFIEKPLSVHAVSDVSAYMKAVLEAQGQQNVVVSVGYMFRYHPAIQRVKSLLKEHEAATGAQLMYLQFTYKCAYSQLDHPFWWRKERSGGPIVEQATHFCDLARFIGGEVLEDTIQATSLCDDHPSGAGKLHNVPPVVHEDEIPSRDRIPRVTVAHWRYENGAVGHLTHGVTLHHKRYEAEFEAWADGLRITVTDCYTDNCRLVYRRGDTDDETVETFKTSDPYHEEDVAFIDAIRTGEWMFL